MSKAVPKGLTKEHVLLALQDWDNGIEHPFGSPTGYELVHDEKRYPPKAVVGIAFRHLEGSILPPKEFSSGQGKGQAIYVLRDLGFTVEPIQPHSKNQDGPDSPLLQQSATKAETEGYFEPATVEDERERKLREIVQRRGQPEFRSQLIGAYRGRCAVTGCDAISALEAAHITPYLGPDSNHVTNGLLLRADIHTLFDLNLIGIDPESLRLVVAEQLVGTCCEELDGQDLVLPKETAMRPSKEALKQRWLNFEKRDCSP